MKPGYKQTDAGVIPSHWEAAALSDLGEFRTGPFGTLLSAREYYAAEGVPLVSVGDLDGGTLAFGDHTPLVPAIVLQRLPQYVLKAGDIIFGRKGGVDRCGLVREDQRGCFLGSDGIRLRLCAEHNAAFIKWQLQRPEIRAWLLQNATGTTMPSMNQEVLGRLRVPLPPLEEQTAIATALDDAEGMLRGLERLIAKKRDLKQAAMQQLLSGQSRLPGFSGEWKTHTFGELASPRKDRVDPRRHGLRAFCVELELIESGTGRITHIADGAGQGSLKSVFRDGDVLFGKLRAYLRKYWLADRPGICSTEIWVLAANAGLATPDFIRQVVATNAFIETACTAYGTHMPRSDWNVVRNMEIHVPPLPEQNAIATVLSDMDAEIAALEARRDKTRALKQGMMQELLTGKTRLVVPSPATESVTMPAAAPAQASGHNWAINEAVVISVLAKAFGSEKFPLGRKRYTKLSYLLHRHVERKAEGYLKKAAGPYNPSTKYKGPEAIAQKNAYIRTHSVGQYSGFIAADRIAQAEGYFEKWYGMDKLQWLEQFRYKKNDDLEVLATVDMAVQDLLAAGTPVTVEAVKGVIRSHPEWEAKLDRAVFSDAHIQAAIQESEELFGRGSDGDTSTVPASRNKA